MIRKKAPDRNKQTRRMKIFLRCAADVPTLKKTKILLDKFTWQCYNVGVQRKLGIKEYETMNKEEILTKAQLEGKEKDLVDREAQKSGAWIAYIVGVVLLILVDTVNGFVFHYVNRGADFALFSMAFVMFLSKYLRIRRRHELIATVFWGLLALAMLVVWVLQLTGVL